MGKSPNIWKLNSILLNKSWVKEISRKILKYSVSSVQLLNHIWLFVTPWTTARQAFLSITSLHILYNKVISSVQFSHSVVSDSLWSHGLQHARPPCPSPTPGVYSNSCPSSRWCHPTISSSVVPASGSFPMSQFFVSGGQSTRVSASASVPPMHLQDWFPLGWTALISLLSKRLSRVFKGLWIK